MHVRPVPAGGGPARACMRTICCSRFLPPRCSLCSLARLSASKKWNGCDHLPVCALQARVDPGRRLLQETDHDHAHDHGADAGVDMKPLELNLTGASGPLPPCMRSSPCRLPPEWAGELVAEVWLAAPPCFSSVRVPHTLPSACLQTPPCRGPGRVVWPVRPSPCSHRKDVRGKLVEGMDICVASRSSRDAIPAACQRQHWHGGPGYACLPLPPTRAPTAHLPAALCLPTLPPCAWPALQLYPASSLTGCCSSSLVVQVEGFPNCSASEGSFSYEHYTPMGALREAKVLAV